MNPFADLLMAFSNLPVIANFTLQDHEYVTHLRNGLIYSPLDQTELIGWFRKAPELNNNMRPYKFLPCQ